MFKLSPKDATDNITNALDRIQESDRRYVMAHVRDHIDRFMPREDAPVKQRTTTQNSAMHVYFQLVADALNEGGHDMIRVVMLRRMGQMTEEERLWLSELMLGIEIPWDSDMVKREIWCKIMTAQTDKTRTRDMDTSEVDQVYQVMAKYLASKWAIDIPWPSNQSGGSYE